MLQLFLFIVVCLYHAAFKNLKNLRDLRLGFNQLSGSIPASLFELPHLQYLTKLRYLNLSSNILVENNVLESLGKLFSLAVINFERTGLSGALQNIGTDTANL